MYIHNFMNQLIEVQETRSLIQINYVKTQELDNISINT